MIHYPVSYLIIILPQLLQQLNFYSTRKGLKRMKGEIRIGENFRRKIKRSGTSTFNSFGFKK